MTTAMQDLNQTVKELGAAKVVIVSGDANNPVMDGGISTITDYLKKGLNQVGAFADPIALPLYPFVNEKFVYGTAPNIDHIVSDTSGGGSVAIANGLITLSTGAAINRTASFRTRRPVLYSAGMGCHARLTVILSATGTGKYREWGVGTLAAASSKPSSAIYFKDNAGVFSLNVRKANADILTVNRADWIDKLDGTGASGLNLADFTTGAPLEIVWPYLGFGDAYFYLIASGVKYLIATIHVASKLTTPFVENPTLYPYGFVENATANTNTTLSFASIGGLLEFDFSKAVGVNYDTPLVSKSSITTETPIYPGEYLTVTGTSGTAFTGVVSLGFQEFQ